MSSKLILPCLIVTGIVGAIAFHLWSKATAIPIAVASSAPDDIGQKACDNVRQVKLKVSAGRANLPDASYLAAEDIKTLFTCRLYEGLGEKPGAIIQTSVTFKGDRVRSEAVVDLSKIPNGIDKYKLGSPGATLLSQIAFKTRKNPLMNAQTVYLAIEGKPMVSDRKFVFYGTPTIQLGTWQWNLKDASKYFRIPDIYAREWLEKEYYLLPMEARRISFKGNLLELKGSRTAW